MKNNDFDTILRTLEAERGIGRDAMLTTIENAMAAAARKSVFTSGDVRVEIDRATLDIRAWQNRIVDDEEKGAGYISLAEARAVKPDAELGDQIETPVDPRVFGRIAAQTAKQAIMQGIHENERDIMQKRYEKQVGRIVTATVRQISRKDTICEIFGGGEAILKGRDKMKNDRYRPMDEFRAVIRFVGSEQDPRRVDDGDDDASVQNLRGRRVKMIDEPSNNPCVKLSRTDPSFVRALFFEQSEELKSGEVEIVNISRHPGVRCKVAVRSRNARIDPVGACVGQRGSRIRPIIAELGGEKIDIVVWSDDIERYAVNALAPATISRVEVLDDARQVIAYVEPDSITPTIGKGGINARLAGELIGWDISIRELDRNGETEEERRARQESFDRAYAEKVDALSRALGQSVEVAAALAKHGFLSLAGIMELTRDDFVAELSTAGDDDMETFSAEDAAEIWNIANSRILESSSSGGTVPEA